MSVSFSDSSSSPTQEPSPQSSEQSSGSPSRQSGGKQRALPIVRIALSVVGLLVLLFSVRLTALALALASLAVLIGLVYLAVLVTEAVKKGQPVARFWAAVDRKMGR